MVGGVGQVVLVGNKVDLAHKRVVRVHMHPRTSLSTHTNTPSFSLHPVSSCRLLWRLGDSPGSDIAAIR